jgi:hypothetical protein
MPEHEVSSPPPLDYCNNNYPNTHFRDDCDCSWVRIGRKFARIILPGQCSKGDTFESISWRDWRSLGRKRSSANRKLCRQA